MKLLKKIAFVVLRFMALYTPVLAFLCFTLGAFFQINEVDERLFWLLSGLTIGTSIGWTALYFYDWMLRKHHFCIFTKIALIGNLWYIFINVLYLIFQFDKRGQLGAMYLASMLIWFLFALIAFIHGRTRKKN